LHHTILVVVLCSDPATDPPVGVTLVGLGELVEPCCTLLPVGGGEDCELIGLVEVGDELITLATVDPPAVDDGRGVVLVIAGDVPIVLVDIEVFSSRMLDASKEIKK
jgi:hypothetical protein